ncbi:helix-turn-helix domain-containing protein [Mucilaginibacter rivuli]|uniref:helix-turn-helix domain-containing protein n=1 Tax=Mucilaginibacter rivuli TaxID=2857527 RepID=UPI0021062139|nr:helix-turn-helix domain-containing protein [Mucilaginibacter rivuli]
MKLDIEVICLEEPAFYKLLEDVVKRLKLENNIQEDEYITGEEAMRKLGITSKTTLQKLRDNGSISFTKDTPTMMYNAQSISVYLKSKTLKTF